jgi:hypothetical protein
MTLDEDDIEAVAACVVELLRQKDRERTFVDAAALAGMLGVGRDWVYAHARQLGAVRLGDGPKAPLRFDVDQVRERLAARWERQPLPDEPVARRRRRSSRSALPTGVRPIRERSTR